MGFDYENRGFTRVPIGGELSVWVTGGEDKAISGTLVNLSMTGALVGCKEQFSADEECVILIVVNEETTLEMRGSVARVESDSMGILFTGISEASYEAHHELLVENAEDGEAVRDEIFGRPHLAPDMY